MLRHLHERQHFDEPSISKLTVDGVQDRHLSSTILLQARYVTVGAGFL